MTLGERIKTCRQKAGMSQEKVAEFVGVSRQAVTKWESNQSAPNTENLFKLAEIFGTTVDVLLEAEQEMKPSSAEQIYYLYKMEEEKKAAQRKQTYKRNIANALVIAAGYLLIYVIGRFIWCDIRESTLISWLLFVRPSGEHSYLYGWLLSSKLFWYAMVISVLPSVWGRFRFSVTTTVGFLVGIIGGMIFGPYPEGAAIGHSHYGWAVWGAVYMISIVVGIVSFRCRSSRFNKHD